MRGEAGEGVDQKGREGREGGKTKKSNEDNYHTHGGERECLGLREIFFGDSLVLLKTNTGCADEIICRLFS